jgi:hypothetical protein
MKIWQLLILVTMLSLCVWLALTNPPMEAYLAFVEAELGKALARSETSQPDRERTILRKIFLAHSHELVVSVVWPHTVRRNWGLLSYYETTALDTHIEVLALGGCFIPLKGIDDAILRLGRVAF